MLQTSSLESPKPNPFLTIKLIKYTLKLINDKKAKIQVKIKIASNLSKNLPNETNLEIKYKEMDSSAVKVNEKVIVKAKIVRRKYNPQRITEKMDTFLKSFVSFKNEGRKYKYPIILKENTFID